MDTLIVRDHPPLERPVLVTAFLGWNDAAESASNAVRYLRRLKPTKHFAEIDPEEFFVFTERRPQVRLTLGRQREISWPSMKFSYLQLDQPQIDLVLGLATEPHLKWKQFTHLIVRLAKELDVREVVTLGGLLADTPHTRPVPLTGIASDPERAEALGFKPSHYQGPTGIIGVLNDACRREGLPYVSLWANAPHYVAGIHNPRATQALLRRFSAIYGLDLNLDDLDRRAMRYESEIEKAIEDNPEIQEYVQRLEATADEGDDEDTVAPPSRVELQSSDVLAEVDRLLRRDDSPPDPDPLADR